MYITERRYVQTTVCNLTYHFTFYINDNKDYFIIVYNQSG